MAVQRPMTGVCDDAPTGKGYANARATRAGSYARHSRVWSGRIA